MQQDFTGGVAELKQPKTEIQDYTEEKTYLNVLQVIKKEPSTYNHIVIKEEIDSNFIKLEDDEEKSALQHFEEGGENINNRSFPIIQEANLFHEPNKHASGKLLRAIELNTGGINSNKESNNENEINFHMQHTEENENRTSLIEGEKKCVKQQSEQQVLHSQEILSTNEFNRNSEQRETAKEIMEYSGEHLGNLDCITKRNLENVEDGHSEFQITDVAHCDPEIIIEKNTISGQEKVKDTTYAAKKNEAGRNKFENRKTLSKAQKRNLLEMLKQQIEQRENLNNIPFPIWSSLTRLSETERNIFINIMKKKFVMKQFPRLVPKRQGETCAVNRVTTRGDIDNLVHSFLQWLAEHWETEGKNFLNGIKNTKLIKAVKKRKLLKNIKKTIYAKKLDPYNLPPAVQKSLGQINIGERIRFLKTVTKYLAKREKADALSTSESFVFPSIATPKENSNFPSRSQIHTGWTTNENKRSENIPFYTYSFERDFQNQKHNAEDTLNIATTSKVSPSIFPAVLLSGCSQTQMAQKSSVEGNSFENYCKSYRSHTNNLQKNIEDTTVSGFSNVFSNNNFTEGTDNRPFYRTRSYNKLYGPDSKVSVIPLSSSNTSRVTGDSPFHSTYPNVFTMQASFSGGAAGSNQAMHNSSRYTPKRKLPDEVASYDEPNLKQFRTSPKPSCDNTNDDSIKITISDDSSPRGTMNEEQASLLTSQLVQLLDKASLESRDQIPRFYNSGLSQGVFTVSCADQTSFDWLRNVVSKLPQLWSGADLHVRHLLQHSARYVQVNVYIPGRAEDYVTTLARLERQNPGLNTRAWKICYQSRSTRGRLLYFEIDELSVQVLKNMNFKAFLGLSCITFRISENTCENKRKPKHY